jgi:hypothetical protein
MQRPVNPPWRVRLSILVGLLAVAVSCAVAYRLYCGGAIEAPRGMTLNTIADMRKEVEAYRQEKHSLPRSWRELALTTIRTDDAGAPRDRWRWPLHYWTDGKRYRITSYGYDGRPGGTGLSYDLSIDDLARPLPPQARIAFRQFVTDRGDYCARAGFHGSGFGMAVTSLLTGAMAALLAFLTLGDRTPPHEILPMVVLRLLVRLSVTTLTALFVGLMIAALHQPSGH